MATSGIGATDTSTTSSSTTSAANSNDALSNLDLNQFLKLMITELQNQDPLNPMDNDKILAQIGEMRQISSSDKLGKTLDSVLLGQNLSSASAMLGKKVNALSDDAKPVSGVVNRVSVSGGVPKLHIGDATVSLSNVSDILPDGAAASGTVTPAADASS